MDDGPETLLMAGVCVVERPECALVGVRCCV